MEFITEQGLNLFEFINLTILLIPKLIVEVLPLAYFSVVLFVYNKISADKELIVMKTSGLSNKQLIKPVIKTGIVLTILSFVFTMYFTSIFNTAFHKKRISAQNAIINSILQEEKFNAVKKNLIVHIKDVKENTLNSILIYDNRKKDNEKITFAEKGTLKAQNDSLVIMLSNGINQEKTKEGKYYFTKFESYIVDLNINLSKIKSSKRLKDYTIFELFKKLPDKPKYKNELIGEINARFFLPLQTLFFGLLAAITILKTKFSRSGNFAWIAYSILMTIVLISVFIALGDSAEENPQFLIPLGYIILISGYIIEYYLLKKERPFFTKKIKS
jgi:lipopolysaccharide export system permease protein